MTPRIIVRSGSSTVTVVPIGRDPLFIGQEGSNAICLADPAVSLKHCSIGRHNGGYELVDLGSQNGTFVNGIPVRRKVLSDGDTIRIGGSELLFAVQETEAADGYALHSPNSSPVSQVTTIPVDQAALDTKFETAVGRMARDLAGLLRISNATISTRNSEQLQCEILRLVLEVVPAQHGAIVLLAQTDDQEFSICGWTRKGRETSAIKVQSDIVRKALWERSAAITDTDQGADGNLHVLCVPLVGVQRALGAIYLTSSKPESPFHQDEIDFLISASRIAAVALENILALDALSSENRQLKEQIFSGKLVGESRPMKKIEHFISRVAGQGVTVLIRGESGTGKELVARSIHHNSPHADRPFVAINCAAIPEALLESELFGHEKGAFTGAVAMKKGKLEVAEDGTLFLDEIGELAPLLQAKLLRALQQREFERLGGNRSIKFWARVVAATNKDLEKAIKSGEFRQDLYYRLNVVSVTLPALRERREDIPLLALYFANKYAASRKRPFKGISAEARTILMNYSWPGNVRELENAIEHAIVLGVSDEILPEDLPTSLLEEQGARVEASRYYSVINKTKRDLILEALRNSSGSFPEAAKALGVHPKYLFRLVRNLKLRTDLD
jgi:transcriptional regulator with GAF, ATPase, and Fis domain